MTDNDTEFQTVWGMQDKMHMLRHDYIAKDSNPAFRPQPAHMLEQLHHYGIISEKRMTLKTREGDKSGCSKIIVVTQERHM